VCVLNLLFQHIFCCEVYISFNQSSKFIGKISRITKVAFVDKWSLFRESETTYLDKLRLAFVDRKPLFAGVVMYRFYCIIMLTENAVYIYFAMSKLKLQ